jgi:hypothetical protein
VSYWQDKGLRMARSLRGGSKRRYLSPDEVKLARHMAQNDASVAEIVAALKWDITLPAATLHLRKNYNITSRRWKLAHNGRPTQVPHGHWGGFEVYRPKTGGVR